MVHHFVRSPISSIRGEKALTTSHRVLMCFIAASALVLSGCGGSNNTKPAAATSPAIADAETVAPAGPTMEEITADAIAVAMAITADPPKKLKFEDGRTHDVNISHTDDDGLEISVVDRGVAGGTQDDTPFDAADAPHAVKGWHGRNFKLGEETEYVTVYTNIEAPGPSSFNVKHNDADVYISATDLVTGAITLLADTPVAIAALADFAASEDFPTAANVDVSLGGTFDGTPGEFKCSGADAAICSITTDADGELTSLGGTWTFTPDDGVAATVAKPTQTDGDYLHFGYWVNSMEDEGETSYEFQAFSGGKKPFYLRDEDGDLTNNVDTVVGAATYAGPAGGMYVLKSLMANGDVASAASGSFTADAELTAKFGGPSVSEDDWFSISGTVTDFMDGMMRRLDGWSVDLKRADFVNRDKDGTLNRVVVDDEPTGNSHSTTFGGATTGGGTWSGEFFGTAKNIVSAVPASGEVDDDDFVPAVPAVPASMPSSVAGQFNGHFANGHVNGAFGAVIQP